MKPEELIAVCLEKQALGLEYVQLVVTSRSRPGGSFNRRVWKRGPKGRWLGMIRPGEWLVDVKIEDVLASLRKGTP